MPDPILPGQVYMVELAQGYERPCVVVSREPLNRGHLVLVVPCSASNVETKTRYPNNVVLDAGAGGLQQTSAAMTHLVQPVEVCALQICMGRLGDDQLTSVLHGLAWTVDLFEHV